MKPRVYYANNGNVHKRHRMNRILSALPIVAHVETRAHAHLGQRPAAAYTLPALTQHFSGRHGACIRGAPPTFKLSWSDELMVTHIVLPTLILLFYLTALLAISAPLPCMLLTTCPLAICCLLPTAPFVVTSFIGRPSVFHVARPHYLLRRCSVRLVMRDGHETAGARWRVA